MDSIDGLNLSSEQTRCSIPGEVSLFDGSTLPACMDHVLRATLNASFEKKWNTNSSQFARTLAEISAKFDESQLELQTQKEEHQRYKSRAQTILAQHQTELANVTQALEAARVHETEVAQLKEQIRRLEETAHTSSHDSHSLAQLEAQLAEAQEQLVTHRQSQHEVVARFDAQIAELERQLAHERNLRVESLQSKDDEYQTALRAVKEELEKHRAKARELVMQKEAQIHTLQTRLKSVGVAASTNLVSETEVATTPSFASETASTNADSAASTPSSTATTATASSTSSSGTGFDTSAFPASPAAAPNASPSGQYHLTQLLASREEELNRSRTMIRQLQDQLRTAEIKSSSNRDRELDLQRRLTDMERIAMRNQEMLKQENIEYLKNVIVKFMETGDEVSHKNAQWPARLSGEYRHLPQCLFHSPFFVRRVLCFFFFPHLFLL